MAEADVVAGTELGVGVGMFGSGMLTETARGIIGVNSARFTNAASSTENTGAA